MRKSVGSKSSDIERFGNYILCEKLNQGGMASVYLARAIGNEGLAKFFAVKRILPQYSDNPEFIEMFKTEAKVAINLQHGNVVQIFDFGLVDKQFYIAMEYVRGVNLRQILKKMSSNGEILSVAECAFILKQVAAGLEHAHQCLDGMTGEALNLTHRDMSPQNVMISYDGEIKVIDFGIAKVESEFEKTQAGIIKGKFSYMSPEQAEGQAVDPRTDIFSSGVILWELLTGERLFASQDDIATLRKVRVCDIPSIRKLNPSVPAELERITQKALSKDKNLRYQTAAALERDLTRFLSTNFPEFSPQEFSKRIKELYKDEIEEARQKLIHYSQISEPQTSQPESSKPEAPKVSNVSKTRVSPVQEPSVAMRRPQNRTQITHITNFPTSTERRAKKSNQANSAVGTLLLLILLGLGYQVGSPYAEKLLAQMRVKENQLSLTERNALQDKLTTNTKEEEVALAPPTSSWGAEIKNGVPLTIESSPPGAEIFIDGERIGLETPARITLEKGTEKEIVLRKDGFINYRHSLVPKDPESMVFPLYPISVGYLTVNVSYGAETTDVFLDGIKLPNRLPLIKHPVPAGRTIEVQVKNRIGAVASESVVVAKDGEKKITLFPTVKR